MKNAHDEPRNLTEAIRYFSEPDVATEYSVARLRWPGGPVCPRCGGREYSYLRTPRLWKCKNCKKQFSVEVGTLFEGSPIELDKRPAAIWMIDNLKDEVGSYEIQQTIALPKRQPGL